MLSSRSQIINLLEKDAIPSDKIDDALAAAGITPDAGAWKTFIDHLLLWLGGLALAFAAVFFIAYNWSDIGRMGKFGMVEVLIILAVMAYWKLGDQSGVGDALQISIFKNLVERVRVGPSQRITIKTIT